MKIVRKFVQFLDSGHLKYLSVRDKQIYMCTCTCTITFIATLQTIKWVTYWCQQTAVDKHYFQSQADDGAEFREKKSIFLEVNFPDWLLLEEETRENYKKKMKGVQFQCTVDK